GGGREAGGGEPFGGELEVGRALRLRRAVEAGRQPLDQAQLAYRGLERAPAHAMLDALGLPQQLRDLAAVLRREVRADPGAQIGRLADVEHAACSVTEEVDAGPARQ